MSRIKDLIILALCIFALLSTLRSSNARAASGVYVDEVGNSLRRGPSRISGSTIVGFSCVASTRFSEPRCFVASE
jgi:hypothetical protein